MNAVRTLLPEVLDEEVTLITKILLEHMHIIKLGDTPSHMATQLGPHTLHGVTCVD